MQDKPVREGIALSALIRRGDAALEKLRIEVANARVIAVETRRVRATASKLRALDET